MHDKKPGRSDVTVCRNLQRGWARSSRLQTVEWSREIVSSQVFSNKNRYLVQIFPTPIEMHQMNVISGAVFSSLQYPKRIPSKQNFEEMVEILKKTIPSRALSYMKWAVAVPLGPEEVLMCLKSKSKSFGGNREHTLLTYNALQSYVLFVEPRGEAQPAKTAIDKALGRDWKTEDRGQVVIAMPNSDFAMRLITGKDPEVVTNATETTSLLVFEDEVVFVEPKEYYQKLLNCQHAIISAKLLSSAEKRWIEKKLNYQALDNCNIRLLEFSCPVDRNDAAKNMKVEVFDCFLIESMFDPNEVLEEVFLEVDYDVRTPQNTSRGVKVTLVKEEDMERARKVLKKNGLEWKEEEFALNKRRMLRIQQFQHNMWAFVDRIWLLHKIFSYNNILIESMVPMRSFNEVRRTDYGALVGNGLRHLSANCGVQEDDWMFCRRSDGLKYRVHFKDSQIGLMILDQMFDEEHGRDVFWETEISDVSFLQWFNSLILGFQPELTPIIRKTFRIARSIRAVFDKIIKNLDFELRHEFVELSEADSHVMKAEDAYHFWTRIYEEWEDGTDVGTIGIEGWKPEFVQKSFEILRKALEPTTIDASRFPELFYGIGEAFVKELESKYKKAVVIDIDKFQEVIRIYGSQAAEAYNDCMRYETMKTTTSVRVSIPLHSPYFNCKKLITEPWIREVQTSLDAEITLDEKQECLLFRGTIEAYEVLRQGLNDINSSFFIKQIRVCREELSLVCAVCFEKTEDYFVLTCGHSFCRKCVNGHVKVRLNKAELKMKCPNNECTEYMTPMEIMVRL